MFRGAQAGVRAAEHPSPLPHQHPGLHPAGCVVFLEHVALEVVGCFYSSTSSSSAASLSSGLFFSSPFFKTSSCESENVLSRWMCACMESLEQPAGLSTRMGFLLRALTLCSCRESSFGGKGPASLQTSSSSFEQIKAAIPNQIQKDAFYGMLEKLRLLPTSSVYFSITGISLSLNEFSTHL